MDTKIHWWLRLFLNGQSMRQRAAVIGRRALLLLLLSGSGAAFDFRWDRYTASRSGDRRRTLLGTTHAGTIVATPVTRASRTPGFVLDWLSLGCVFNYLLSFFHFVFGRRRKTAAAATEWWRQKKLSLLLLSLLMLLWLVTTAMPDSRKSQWGEKNEYIRSKESKAS